VTAAHGIGSSATEVTVYTGGVAVDRDGNLIIANQGRQAGAGRILAMAARTSTSYGQAMTAGHINTVAGTGRFGFPGDDGTAIEAELKVS